MSVTTFLSLLMAFAAITAILTQGLKSLFDSLKLKYSSNVLALVVAVIVGCGGTAIFYIALQIPFNLLNSIYIVLMGIANWLTAMLGYDKVKQAIEQVGKINNM